MGAAIRAGQDRVGCTAAREACARPLSDVHWQPLIKLVSHSALRQPFGNCLPVPAGSSQANPFACVASGIAALWGPAHGGANEAVLKVGRCLPHWLHATLTGSVCLPASQKQLPPSSFHSLT
jgi:hypothetical protein